MEYKYVQNPSAQKPIILLDKYIKADENGDTVVDGGRMAREILALSNKGIPEAEMWINAKGGQWSEGTSIVGAMNNSAIEITTVNMGFVDSTAGHIFQAGKKRVWMDYGLGLVHEIQGQGSAEVMEAMNMSVATMLCGKTNRTQGQVRELMAASTMMDAKMAKEYGFCDEVRPSNSILHFTNSSDPNEISDFGQKQIKKLLPKNKNMEAVNNLLGLTNEASESAQLVAINKIIEAKNAAETALTAKETELTATKATLTETNGKLLVAENTILTATNENKAIKATALIEEHRGKRIADTPENITRLTNAAIADYDGTKSLIEAMNLNVTAPKTPVTGQRSANAPVISVSEYRSR